VVRDGDTHRTVQRLMRLLTAAVPCVRAMCFDSYSEEISTGVKLAGLAALAHMHQFASSPVGGTCDDDDDDDGAELDAYTRTSRRWAQSCTHSQATCARCDSTVCVTMRCSPHCCSRR
jgi:hypothetical protein